MKTELLHGESGFTALSREWDILVSQAAVKSVFFTFAFQKTWAIHSGRIGSMRFLVTRDGKGKLVSVFPAVIEETGDGAWVYVLSGDRDTWDHRDIIVRRGEEKEVFRHILRYICRERWDFMEFHSVPETSPTVVCFCDMARHEGFDVHISEETICPVLRLPSSWNEYLSLLDRKDRHELRRKMRRIEGAGKLALRPLCEGKLLEGEMETFFCLHKLSSPDKDDFMDMTRRRFFEALVSNASRKDFVLLFHLELDGRPIASLLCFTFAGRIFAYNSGYDPAYSPLSPGIVLFAKAIEYAVEREYRYFDFLRGDEAYKFRLGAQPYRLMRITVGRSPISNR
jgi:hypothetical protein